MDPIASVSHIETQFALGRQSAPVL